MQNYNPLIADRKRYLAGVFRETIQVIKEGEYRSPKGETVMVRDAEMLCLSRFHVHEFNVNNVPSREEPTIVEVVNDDSIYAGKRLLDEGYNPIVLNFANQYHAGGGVESGCRAQEEDLCRRSTLFRSLVQFTPVASRFGVKRSRYQYPMGDEFGGIYSPYVKVFRDGANGDYAFLDNYFHLAFVSVAAIRNPRLEGGRIAHDLVPIVKNKIRTILRIGLKNGHDAIVLGAFGCGAFKNPPQHMAELFKEVLSEDEFRDKYRKVVFAILENHHSQEAHNPHGNLEPFRQVFAK